MEQANEIVVGRLRSLALVDDEFTNLYALGVNQILILCYKLVQMLKNEECVGVKIPESTLARFKMVCRTDSTEIPI